MANLLVIMDFQNVILSYDKKKYSDEIIYAQKAIQHTENLVDAMRHNDDDIAWVAFADSKDDALSSSNSGIHPDLMKKIHEKDLVFIKNTKSASGTLDITGKLSFDDALDRNYKNIIFTGTSIIDCLKKTILYVKDDLPQSKFILARDACCPSPAFTNGKDLYIKSHGITSCSTNHLITYLKHDKLNQCSTFNNRAETISIKNRDTSIEEHIHNLIL